MIRINMVSKRFENVKSLIDVSLNIEKGSIFGLIGSNGSGKSTLLKILCGVYKQDAGSVIYDDAPVYENPEVKQNVLYLSDDQYFMNQATIADMKSLYRSVYPSFSDEKYDRYLKMFGLDENRRISTFSKGMQKQAAVLLGVSAQTEYLLCDETLDGLDPVMRQMVRKIIAGEVAEREMSVIFASHNLSEVEDICDHIALLHHGELIIVSGLDDIKEGLHKVQVSFEREAADEAAEELKALEPVSVTRRGSLFTIILRGSEEAAAEQIAALSPVFSEFIPLTLEEIFIAEMEERGYEFDESII